MNNNASRKSAAPFLALFLAACGGGDAVSNAPPVPAITFTPMNMNPQQPPPAQQPEHPQ